MVTSLSLMLRHLTLIEACAPGVVGCLFMMGSVLPGPLFARDIVEIESRLSDVYQWPKNVHCDSVLTEGRMIYENSGRYEFQALLGMRVPHDIAIGNLFSTPAFGAFFFRSREELKYFERNGRVRSFMAFLSPFHTVRADQKIDHDSMGAEVIDEKIGSGYALFVPSNVAEGAISECFPRSLRIHKLFSIRYSYRSRRSVVKKQDGEKAIPMGILKDF